MEDRGGQHRRRATLDHGGGEVFHLARPATGDDGNVHRAGDRLQQRQVVSGFGAVPVHAGQQDFPGPARLGFPGEGHRINAGLFPSAMREDFPMVAHGARINRHDHRLRSGLCGAARDHAGVGHGGGIDRHLVGARAQQRHQVVGAAHPAAHGQRHETLLRRRRDNVHQRAPALMRGRDVEEAQLVRALRIIGFRQRDGVARVFQVNEIDALDGTAVLHVETGNDAGLQAHDSGFSGARPQREAPPAAPHDRDFIFLALQAGARPCYIRPVRASARPRQNSKGATR